MRKILFTLMICSVFCTANAQKIGHFSFQTVMQSLPAYVSMQRGMETMRSQYASELEASEQEFTEKYEMFIEQQATLAPSIREKRQADLQDLYRRNMKFREDSERLLKQSEADQLKTIREKVMKAVEKVGQQGEYLFIVNTDSEACPYIAPESAEDVTAQIVRLAK